MKVSTLRLTKGIKNPVRKQISAIIKKIITKIDKYDTKNSKNWFLRKVTLNKYKRYLSKNFLDVKVTQTDIELSVRIGDSALNSGKLSMLFGIHNAGIKKSYIISAKNKYLTFLVRSLKPSKNPIANNKVFSKKEGSKYRIFAQKVRYPAKKGLNLDLSKYSKMLDDTIKKVIEQEILKEKDYLLSKILEGKT